MRKLSAQKIYPVTSAPIENGVVVVDNDGKILEVGRRDDYDSAELEVFDGILIPGMVNTHCHLELSHMKGHIPNRNRSAHFYRERSPTPRSGRRSHPASHQNSG
jgi:cytosine/adenosine deaminase-related metal-dependent hydrolase